MRALRSRLSCGAEEKAAPTEEPDACIFEMNSQQFQKSFFLPSWCDFGRCCEFRVLKGSAGGVDPQKPKLEIEMIEVGNGR